MMSEKPEFKEVTAGTGTNKVVINDNGVHVGGKTYINNSGLNANNQKITNVATGTAGTDAVNVDQLNAAIGGTAKATTVKAKDANVTVTKGTSAETGGREYTVGLGNVSYRRADPSRHGEWGCRNRKRPYKYDLGY